jgi:hypothetical protein
VVVVRMGWRRRAKRTATLPAIPRMRALGAVAAAAAFAAGVQAQVQVTCVGDSITAGVCSSTTHGYPAILQGLLGSNYAVLNAGNSGKTMLKHGLCGPPPAGDCSYWDTP